jgi:hypothetical protein
MPDVFLRERDDNRLEIVIEETDEVLAIVDSILEAERLLLYVRRTWNRKLEA